MQWENIFHRVNTCHRKTISRKINRLLAVRSLFSIKIDACHRRSICHNFYTISNNCRNCEKCMFMFVLLRITEFISFLPYMEGCLHKPEFISIPIHRYYVLIQFKSPFIQFILSQIIWYFRSILIESTISSIHLVHIHFYNSFQVELTDIFFWSFNTQFIIYLSHVLSVQFCLKHNYYYYLT